MRLEYSDSEISKILNDGEWYRISAGDERAVLHDFLGDLIYMYWGPKKGIQGWADVVTVELAKYPYVDRVLIRRFFITLILLGFEV